MGFGMVAAHAQRGGGATDFVVCRSRERMFALAICPQNTGELLPAYPPPRCPSTGPCSYTYIRGAWTRKGEGAFNCHASLEAQLAVKNSIFGNVASLLGWWLVCFDTW